MLIADYQNLYQKDFQNYCQTICKQLSLLQEKVHANAASYHLLPKQFLYQAKSFDDTLPLHAVPYILKDNIATVNHPTSASSNIMRNFLARYSATCYKKLKAKGSFMIAKAVLDELGMGGHGVYSNQKPLHNPYNHRKIIGGSSSGSCWLIANGFAAFSIATDTGDSIRKPAAFNCLYGFKPTWGLISRYGLFPFAPSFDCIGVIARSPLDCGLVTKHLAGFDKKDSTSQYKKNYQLNLNPKPDLRQKKLVVFQESIDALTNKQVKNQLLDLIAWTRDQGILVDVINFNQSLLEILIVIYRILSFSEAVSCNSNLTGTTFGNQINKETWNKSIQSTRNQYFLREVKKRFLIGAYCLRAENIERIYNKSREIRALIIDKINQLLSVYDGILTPMHDGAAPDLSSISDNLFFAHDLNLSNNLSLLANLVGLPSISFPYGFIDGMPFGFALTTRLFDEQLCIDYAQLVSSKTQLIDITVNPNL